MNHEDHEEHEEVNHEDYEVHEEVNHEDHEVHEERQNREENGIAPIIATKLILRDLRGLRASLLPADHAQNLARRSRN